MARTANIGPGSRRQQAPVKLGKDGWAAAWRIMRDVLKTHKWTFGAVMGCIVISSVATLASTLFTRTLIDDYIAPLSLQSQPDYTPLIQTLLRLGGILLIGVGCAYLNTRLMIRVTQSTLLRLRQNIFRHMQELPISYFDTHAHGDIMSVYTNDIDTLRQMIGSSLTELFSSAITIAITLTAMLKLSPTLTLLTMVLTLLMIVSTKQIGKRSAYHFRNQQADLAAVNAMAEEIIGGQKTVKTFSHEHAAIAGFEELNDRLCNSACNANRMGNIVMPVNGNISNLIYVLCATVGAVIAINPTMGVVESSLTVGTIVSFLTLIKNFTRPVSGLSNQIKTEADQGNVTLVNAQIDERGNITPGTQPTGTWAWQIPQDDGTFEYVRQRGEIDFDNVCFGYTEDRQVLHHIILNTDAGQKIALVGGTGAGKTTITNLINRFYNINQGKICYDGIDISQIRLKDLRHSLGMVLQDTHLFTGSVMDNIRYGRLEADDQACIDAAKLVGADDFIERLPQGYQTIIQADEGSLSQGERQLIAIARAAVANPPALILDEATANIDTHTEMFVQRGMDQLMNGRSTFVIAHRLSTIRNANLIVVMEHGQIAQIGTHEQLLAQKGLYRQLYSGSTDK